MRIRFVISLLVFSFWGAVVWAAQVISLDDLGAIRVFYPGTISFEVGAAVAGAGDFDGDGYRDALVGAPSFEPADFTSEYNTGAVFILSGAQLNHDRGEMDVKSDSFQGITILGKFGSKLGQVLDGVGDVNGDGYDDIALGSAIQKNAYILFGTPDARRVIPISDLKTDGILITHTGFSLSKAGDFNGDGFADVVVGNPRSQKKTYTYEGHEYESDTCHVSIIYGNSTLPEVMDSRILSDQVLPMFGRIAGKRAGQNVCGGMDIDADGYSDIVIVAPKGGKDLKGRAYLIQGREQVVTIDYKFVIDHCTRFVRTAGDVNDDGYPDLLIGRDDQSILLLWGGDHLQGVVDLNHPQPQSGVLIHNSVKNSQSAYGVGDVNGDGFADIAVGMPMDSVRDRALAGRVIFLLGSDKLPETIDLHPMTIGEMTPVEYVTVEGTKAFEAFGASIAGLGDIQNDGFADVIIGAPVQVIPGEPQSESPGSAYVIQGKSLFQVLQTRRSLFFSIENNTHSRSSSNN